jgi:hypothetical protein
MYENGTVRPVETLRKERGIKEKDGQGDHN